MLLSMVYGSSSFSHSVLYLILILICISLTSNELVLICHLNLKKPFFKSLAHFLAIFFIDSKEFFIYAGHESSLDLCVADIFALSVTVSFELIGFFSQTDGLKFNKAPFISTVLHLACFVPCLSNLRLLQSHKVLFCFQRLLFIF